MTTAAHSIPRDNFSRLRVFNLAMGLLHLAQGAAMLALSTSFACL